jgi:superfamily II DNA or RNA helicase
MMSSPAQAVTGILTDLADSSHKAIVVDSPPGAGKSTLVVRAARQLAAEDGTQRMIVAQTNEQVDDLIDRLATADPALPIGRLSAAGYEATERVTRSNVAIATKTADLIARPGNRPRRDPVPPRRPARRSRAPCRTREV